MSYRIEDLLETAQQGAPAPRTSTEDIIAGAQAIRARRRWAAVAGAGGAAIVTVAVVAGLTGTVFRADRPTLPAAPNTPSSSATSSPPAAPKTFTQPVGFSATVGQTRVGKFQVGPVRQVTAGFQLIPVYRDGYTIGVDDVEYPMPDADITLYRPGVYDSRSFGTAEVLGGAYGPPKKATVTGLPAIEREVLYTLPDLDDLHAKMKEKDFDIRTTPVDQIRMTRTAFAWEYADDAWATFVPGTGREQMSRAEALTIIEAMTPAAAEPIRMPYTFGWLPDGWRVIGAAQATPEVDELVSEVALNRRKLSAAELADPMDYHAAGDLKIFHGTPKDINRPANGEIRCDNGGGFCTMNIEPGYFAEFQKVGKGLTISDIRHILRELRFTKVADQRSWRPVE